MTAPKTSRTPRHRSPAYPAIDLQAAIAKAQTFYTKQKRNAITVPVAIQTLGYSPTNSDGKRFLSALVGFGLLDEETINKARHVKISTLCLNILRHENQPAARLPFLRETAVKPPIYADMVNQWPDELPSDLAITQFLEYDKGFNPTTLQKVIRNFRATYDLAQLGNRAADPQEQSEEEALPATAPTPPVAHGAPAAAPQEVVEAEAEQGAVETPPGVQSKSSKPNTTPAGKDEEEKYIVPLLSGRRLVVRYPKVMAESEIQMVESALAMIRASIGAE